MAERKHRLPVEPLEPLIHAIRGQRVILDTDLARVYGVSTRALNQAVKRNRQRFPEDFAFQLTAAEDNRSQIVIGSQKHRDPRFRPWGYTEHGALMAANVLRSLRAVQMSVYVIRAFVRLREQIGANQAILKRLAEIDKTLLQHDTALREIYQRLLPLLRPRPEPERRRIGFHKDEP